MSALSAHLEYDQLGGYWVELRFGAAVVDLIPVSRQLTEREADEVAASRLRGLFLLLDLESESV